MTPDATVWGAVVLALVLALAAPAQAQQAQQAQQAPPAEHDERATARLIARLAAGPLPEGEAARTLEALVAQGEAAHGALGRALPGLPPPGAALALEALAARPGPQAREALLRAARDGRAAVRRAAAEHLVALPGDPRATAALVALTHDGDPDTAERAFGALLTGAFPGCWDPLLDALTFELQLEAPAAARLYPLTATLQQVLARDADGQAPDRLRRLLEVAAGLDDGAARARLLEVALRSRAAAALPYLLRVVERAAGQPDRGAAAPDDGRWDVIDEALAGLEPLEAALVAGAVDAVARAGEAAAFEPLRRLTQARDAAVRRAALRALWPCAPDDAARAAARRALVDALGAGDRAVRVEAHGALRRHLKVDLPLSAPRWLRWLERREAAEALAARAAAAGYEGVADYLRDHPDEAGDDDQDEEVFGVR